MLKRVCDLLLSHGWGTVIGLALFFVGLLQYRSYANRSILGLWSYPFFAFILLAFFAVMTAAILTFKTQLSVQFGSELSSRSFALATLLWGGGYFISAIDRSDDGARIVDFNLIGSVNPLAMFLEWGALVCVFVAIAQTLWTYRMHRWACIALMALPLGAVLILAEGLARTVTVVFPEPQGFPTYRSQQWERRYVKLNSLGFRDSEHVFQPEANTRRLLIIGDSYAFGWGLEDMDDRFGEQMGVRLTRATGMKWEVMTASCPDTHTLVHLGFLEKMLPYHPDLVILLYVFNDIDYLAMVTPRQGQSERPRSLWEYLDPIRLFYRNSFLFQEVYIRVRQLNVSSVGVTQRDKSQSQDPYWNQTLVGQHLQDVLKFIKLAMEAGATAVMLPFDVAIAEKEELQRRYAHFVEEATVAGIPTWSASGAFAGYTFDQLTVNVLDRHPNKLANRLLAEFVGIRAAETVMKDQRVSQ